MTIAAAIGEKLASLHPESIEVLDESGLHAGHAGASLVGMREAGRVARTRRDAVAVFDVLPFHSPVNVCHRSSIEDLIYNTGLRQSRAERKSLRYAKKQSATAVPKAPAIGEFESETAQNGRA